MIFTMRQNAAGYALLLAGLLASGAGFAQEKLTLGRAYELSEKNFPAIRQRDLIGLSETLYLKNIRSGFLPQLSLNGQASYQSDVTQVNIQLPGVKVPTQPKDQYRITADLNQVLYDGGSLKSQQTLQTLGSSVEQSKIDVELHQLKMRINQIYFNILYQDQLLRQNALATRDIQIGIDRVRPQVENEVILRSNLHVLEAQLLQTRQRAIEIRNTRAGLLDALSLLTGTTFPENTTIETPSTQYDQDTSISRPELRLFQNQARLLEGQLNLINARNRPKASLFFQGGYGRPGLNLLSTDFDLYYITGLRLNWSLGGFYNAKREKQLVDVNNQAIKIQQETFLLNTGAQLRQVRADIRRYEELIVSDKEIIAIREKITTAAKAQLENAVITANDYLREINAEDQARQALAVHQLQLLQARVQYDLTSGK